MEGISSSDTGVPNIPGPYISPEQTESFPLKQALYGNTKKSNKDWCPCIKSDEGGGLKVIVTCFFILSVIITVALAAQIYFGDYQLVPHGSVATDSHLCSVMGTDILKDGGNAVDAAVASTVCMGVVNPHVTGLGGGGFLLVYDHRKKEVRDVIDFREVAPSLFNPAEASSAPTDGDFIGIPGLIRGLGMAHALYGKLEWKAVIMPSVLLARRGFQVPESLIWALTRIKGQLQNYAKLQEIFSSLEPGQNRTLPRLSDALEKIAILGPDELYNGSVADDILKAVQIAGGKISRHDLSVYQPIRRNAIQAKLYNFDIYVPDAPSGGPLLLSILEHLQNDNSSDKMHFVRMLAQNLEEIYQRYEGFWGDPEFLQTGDDQKESAWNSPEAVASHVAAVDLDDLYVTVVSGLNTWFGSRIMTESEFILNNALRNFDIGNNTAQAGKRPLSLAVPIVATQNRHVCGRRLVLGAGDASIAAQLLIELLLLNKNVTLSVEAPRYHIMPNGKQVGYEVWNEPALDNGTIVQLESMGYKLQKLPKPYQSCNIVEKIGDTLISHSDSRGGGIASRF